MTGASALAAFDFEDVPVRAFTARDGLPWFVLVDVCRVLEVGNPSDAARRLDDDEKQTLDNVEGIGDRRAQQLTIVNESGLYSLILTSRKPAAKRFKKWVTAEVLPEIRRTGSYRAGGEGRGRKEALAAAEGYARFYGRPAARWHLEQTGFAPPPDIVAECERERPAKPGGAAGAGNAAPNAALVEAIGALMRSRAAREPWEGTATALLAVLNGIVPAATRQARTWPRTANMLGAELRRATPGIAAIGLSIELMRAGHVRERLIRIAASADMATNGGASAH